MSGFITYGNIITIANKTIINEIDGIYNNQLEIYQDKYRSNLNVLTISK